MRAAGLRVWFDELEMGHDLHASMSGGIAKSDVVVVLVSPDYAASATCMFELRAAVAAGKPVVACLAEPGAWQGWQGVTGSAGPGGRLALTPGHELVALARLKTHLYCELGEASRVAWAAEGGVAPADRRHLLAAEALPRLLSMVVQAAPRKS